METIRCSLGIMAHNEAANIGRLLARVAASRLERVRVAEIIVVASGCTDDTEAIVRAAAAADPRIRLISQPTREGKASAMNLFLRDAACDVLILSSADLLPSEDAIERLVSPFADPEVGMTACRPEPVFYDRLDDAIRSASMFDETEYKAFQKGLKHVQRGLAHKFKH